MESFFRILGLQSTIGTGSIDRRLARGWMAVQVVGAGGCGSFGCTEVVKLPEASSVCTSVALYVWGECGQLMGGEQQRVLGHHRILWFFSTRQFCSREDEQGA